MTAFSPLWDWMNERDGNLQALHDAIKFADETGLIRTDHPDYAKFEELWNKACEVLNRPQPKRLIQVAVRYESTLAAIAAMPMPMRKVEVRPKLAALLASGESPAPRMEQEVIHCLVCQQDTPFPILDGKKPGHRAGCPILLATQALTLPKEN